MTETWDCCGDNKDDCGDYEQGVDDYCYVASLCGCSDGNDKGAAGTGG